MRESVIEEYFNEQVEAHGGMSEKFKSPQKAKVPDRIATWPKRVDFVELKATGEEPDGGQLRDHARRRKLGQRVYVIDSKPGVDLYIHAVKTKNYEDGKL